MMKRAFVFVLAMILLFSLAACGKSEEEQAQNEIYEHMKEEAAQDGIDLDALLASEQAAYEERHQEFLEEQAQAQDFQAARVAPLLDELEAAYGAYWAATTSADMISTGKAFKNLYAEYVALEEEGPSSLQGLLTQLERRIGRRVDLAECIYMIKAAYADFADKEAFHEAWCHYNLEENNAYIALIGIDETSYVIDDIQILKTDGSICKIDLSDIVTESTSYIQPMGIVGENFMLYTIDNADYLYFEFPIDGAVATGTKSESAPVTYKQFWFDSMEEFVLAEKRVR